MSTAFDLVGARAVVFAAGCAVGALAVPAGAAPPLTPALATPALATPAPAPTPVPAAPSVPAPTPVPAPPSVPPAPLVARTGTAALPSAGELELTSRAVIEPDALQLTTRTVLSADWGKLVTVADAAAVGDERRPTFSAGVKVGGLLIGPLRAAGAWRELANPLGYAAGSEVFAESTALHLDAGLDPAARGGLHVQLGDWLSAGTSAAQRDGHAPPVAALVLRPLAVFAPSRGQGDGLRRQLETYLFVRSAAPPQIDGSWLLDAPSFPGGPVAVAGLRAGVASAAAALHGTANVAWGRLLPPALHVRLDAERQLPLGRAAAMWAAAQPSFTDLDGGAPPVPWRWALQLQHVAEQEGRLGFNYLMRLAGGARPRAFAPDPAASAASGAELLQAAEVEVTRTLALAPSLVLSLVTSHAIDGTGIQHGATLALAATVPAPQLDRAAGITHGNLSGAVDVRVSDDGVTWTPQLALEHGALALTMAVEVAGHPDPARDQALAEVGAEVALADMVVALDLVQLALPFGAGRQRSAPALSLRLDFSLAALAPAKRGVGRYN